MLVGKQKLTKAMLFIKVWSVVCSLSPVTLTFEVEIEIQCVPVKNTLESFLVAVLPFPVQNPECEILQKPASIVIQSTKEFDLKFAGLLQPHTKDLVS